MASVINSDNGVVSGVSGLKYSADNSGVLVLQTNGTTALTIDTSQNLGIGTASPGAKLQVAANNGGIASSAGAGTAAYLYLAGNGTTIGTTSFDILQGAASEAYVYNRANQPLIFGTNNTERMRIDNSGNVGIGTSSPAYSLDIQKPTANVRIQATTGTNASYIDIDNTGGYFFIGKENSVGSSFGLTAYSSVLMSTAAVPLIIGTNSAERMRIDSSGNVIVGGTTARAVINSQNNASTGVTSYDASNLNTANNTTKFAQYGFSGFDTAGSWKPTGYIQVAPSDVNYVSSVMSIQTRTSDATSEKFRINAGGAITTPYQPSFFSIVTGGTYTGGSQFGGSLTGTNPTARASGYSNGLFTASVAGYYSFNFQVYDFNGLSAPYSVYKNGAGYVPSDWFQMIAISGTPMTTWSFTIYLAANDYIQMGLRTGYGSTINIYGGHSYFAGFLVG